MQRFIHFPRLQIQILLQGNKSNLTIRGMIIAL